MSKGRAFTSFPRHIAEMDILIPFQIALSLLFSGDAELMSIIGIPQRKPNSGCDFADHRVAAWRHPAAYRFPGRTPLIVISNTFLGMPPVVIGLLIYLLISRAGPLGFMGILYTRRR